MMRTLVFSLLAVSGMSMAFADATTSVAVTPAVNLPPVGLGATETLEVNVANLASNSSNGTAASCTGTVTFFDATGKAIGAAQAFTVTAGQTSLVRLPFSSTGGTGARTTLRAAVALTSPTSAPRPPCTLSVTMAIFETSSGTTAAVIDGVQSLGVVGGFATDSGRSH